MIDLNKEKGRRVIEIRLADKTFRIVRVVTGVRQMYADWMARTADSLRLAQALEQGPEEPDIEFESRVEAVTKQIEEFTAERKEAYYQMLELILDRNGYELDREWWEKNTDEFDQQAFMRECLMKDASAQKKTMTGDA